MSEKEFIDLIEQHQGIIHKVCRIYTYNQHDYDDLFQEIMVQLWQSIPRYQGKSKLTTYMYKIALFTALNKAKKAKRRQLDLQDLPDHTTDESADRVNDILNAIIQQLNDVDKALISLYLDEKDYKEMAEILGITESNVGVRLNRVKEKMRKILKTQYHGA